METHPHFNVITCPSKCSQLDTPVSPTEGHQDTTDPTIVQCFLTRRKHSLLQMKVQLYLAGWHRGNCSIHNSCRLLKLPLQKSKCGFREFHLSLIGHQHSSLLLSEIEYRMLLGFGVGIHELFHRPWCRVLHVLGR